MSEVEFRPGNSLTEFTEEVSGAVSFLRSGRNDPPFNTAQTFASYEDNLEHSIWVTMM